MGEALSKMITVVREANLIDNFKAALDAPMVTHLQFVDDTLIFCAAKEERVENMVAILGCFEGVSSLKVNLFKSALIGILVEGNILRILADFMWCRVGSLPASYFGFPLCLSNASNNLWNPIVERVEHKLASRKAKYMSLGARLTLIHSYLFSNV